MFGIIMEDLQKDLEKDIFNMILNFRSKASVTFSTTLHVVKIISSVIQRITNQIFEGVDKYFNSVAGLAESHSPFLRKMESTFEKIKSSTLSYDSEDKIRRRYQSHPLFVPPKSVVVSSR